MTKRKEGGTFSPVNKLIETVLPLKEINDAAIRERAGKVGHPANLHMWWGRSPLSSSLAVLSAAVLDYSEETVLTDMDLLANLVSGNQDIIDTMRDRLKKQDLPSMVYDPFVGFGGIPIAAGKLGMKTSSNDLNSVAVLLTRASVDIPARFASMRPIHPGAASRDVYSGAEGLAEDVRYFGEWMGNQALNRLSDVYPPLKTGETPFAWLWVRTVKCPNPACNCQIPLGSSFVLQNSKNSHVWAEPIIKDGKINFDIHNEECPADKEKNKVGGNGARFRCPLCGEITTGEYIKKMGIAHELGAAMLAVVTNTDGNKAFLTPDETQRTAAAVQRPENVPIGDIPTNTRWFSPPGYGITEYANLFTPRQLLMLTTFSDLICEAQNMATSAALASGMSATDGSLETGGHGALAYGQAVGVYLALVVDKLVDHNSSMCSWRTASANIRSTVGMQTIPMTWTFAEGNPFSNVSGNYKTMLASVVSSVEHLSCGLPASVTQGNAITMEYPKNVLICTELPYYRDIGYADLSDFFYIWLRRNLKGAYPQMFVPMVTSREELSTVSTYYGVAKDEADKKYRSDMKVVCEKIYESCSADYPALLFYRFRKNDLESMQCGGSGKNESAWEFMLESLLAVGFSVTAVWPMRTEPISEKADSMRILIVARKRLDREGPITRRSFINTLRRELPVRVQLVMTGHISPEDELLSYIGQGIGIFSWYKTVLNADGSAMCVHDALQIIYQECINNLSLREKIVSDGGDAIKED